MTPQSITRDLTSTIIAALVLTAMLALSYWVMQPFLPALIWACMIVIASWRILLGVEKRLWGRRGLAVLAMTTGLVLVLIIPLIIATSAILDNVGVVSEHVQRLTTEGIPPPPEWVHDLPLIGDKLEKRWQQAATLKKDEVLSRLFPYIGSAFTWFVHQIGSFGQILLHLVLTVILSAILYANGEAAAAGVKRFAGRLAHKRGEEAVNLAAQAIRAVASGVILTALIQCFMALIGLLLAGVPYATILASVIFLLGIIQIGAGPVLVGVLIWLFYGGPNLTAWLFLIWAVVIMLADNFIRPFLIKRGANLPLILIFAGVIGGLISFGIIGIFVGPVVLAVSYTWLQAWMGEAAEA